MKTRVGHHETSCLPLGPWLSDLYPAPTWISALLAFLTILTHQPSTLASSLSSSRQSKHSLTYRTTPSPFIPCLSLLKSSPPTIAPFQWCQSSHHVFVMALCHGFLPATCLPGSPVCCPRCRHWGRCTSVGLSISMPFWGEFLSDHS